MNFLLTRQASNVLFTVDGSTFPSTLLLALNSSSASSAVAYTDSHVKSPVVKGSAGARLKSGFGTVIVPRAPPHVSYSCEIEGPRRSTFESVYQRRNRQRSCALTTSTACSLAIRPVRLVHWDRQRENTSLSDGVLRWLLIVVALIYFAGRTLG